MHKTNSFLIILIIITVFLSSNEIHASNQQRPSIKIGVLVPDKIILGINAIKGVELAVEEINSDGVNVGGTIYNIELFKETSSGVDGLPNVVTSIEGLANLQEDDDVLAIIGGFKTEVVTQLQKELLETPFLGIRSTAPITSDYFFRIGPTNGSRQAYSLAEFYGVVMNDLGVKNITIVREDDVWTTGIAGGVKAIIAGAYAAMGAVNNFTFSNDLVISKSALSIAVESALSSVGEDVNALLTLFSGSVGGLVTKSWAKLNMTQYLAGINEESKRNDFFLESDGAAYGEIEQENVPLDLNLTSKSGPFKVNFKNKYKEDPTYISFTAYDAVYLLIEAIKAAGSPSDGVVLQAALVDTDLVGAAGRYKFTSEFDQSLSSAQKASCTTTNCTVVHDLFTPLTYGVHAGEFVGARFAQWQKNGEKVTVWGHKSFSEDVSDLQTGLSILLKTPIDHSDFGTIPTSHVTTSSLIKSSASSIFSSSISESSKSKAISLTTTPGFSFYILIVLISISTTFRIIKKRKIRKS